MKDLDDLKRELYKIDGRGYKAYKSLEGDYKFSNYVLHIDHVQGDPFAAPSRIRVSLNSNFNKIPEELFDTNNKRIAVCDFLTRTFNKNINKYAGRVSGSGKSGIINISRCTQEILDRTAVTIDKEKLEARFEVGFPARGRSVLAKELEKILYEFLPKIVENSLIYNNIDKDNLINRVKLVVDQ
ncbi:ABC-ATPase domain-containing protein, partial [Clostridium chrysemydis]|uniref:ABC-ATPase domain-containing protein n=1 Tax=Clostridium chrysemydis TaxID=2665504 RepID=UPI003F30ECAC